MANDVKIVLRVDDQGTARIEHFGKATSKSLGSIETSAASAGRVLKSVGGTLAAAFSVNAIRGMIDETARVGREFSLMSQRVGVSVEQISALSYAAKRSGTDLETFEKTLNFTAKQMYKISEGAGGGVNAFRDLNISLKTADGQFRSTFSVFIEAAEKLSKMEDQTKKTALASQLFGRSGRELIPMLNSGSEGIAKLMERSEELGVVWNDTDIKAAKEYRGAISELEAAWGGLKKVMLVTAGPFLAEGTKAVTEGLLEIQDMVKGGELEKEILLLQESLRMEESVKSWAPAWMIPGKDQQILSIKARINALKELQAYRAKGKIDPEYREDPVFPPEPYQETPEEREKRLADAARKRRETEVEQDKKDAQIAKEVGEAWDEAGKEGEIAWKSFNDEQEYAQDLAKESTRIYEQLAESISSKDVESFDLREQLLQEKYESYKSHLEALAESDERYADGVVILDKWLADQKRELEKERIREHGNALETMAVAWDDFSEDNLNSSKAWYGAWSGTFENIDQTFEDSVVDGIRDGADDIKDIWKNLGDYLLDTWIRTAYRIAMTEIAGNLSMNFGVNAAGGATQGLVSSGTQGAAGAGGAGIMMAGGGEWGTAAMIAEALPAATVAAVTGIFYAANQYKQKGGNVHLTNAAMGPAGWGMEAYDTFAHYRDKKKYQHAGEYTMGLTEFLDKYEGVDDAPEGVKALKGLLDGFEDSLDNLPDWLGGRYKSDIEATLGAIEGMDLTVWSDKYRNISANMAEAVALVSQAFAVGIENLDEKSQAAVRDLLGITGTMPEALEKGLVAWQADIANYYLEVAQSAADIIGSALPAALGAQGDQWASLTSGLFQGLTGLMSSELTTAMQGMNVYENLMGPFVDKIKQAVDDATETIVTQTGWKRMSLPMGGHVSMPVFTTTEDFDPEAFRRMFTEGGAIDAFKAQLDELKPMYEEVFKVYDEFEKAFFGEVFGAQIGVLMDDINYYVDDLTGELTDLEKQQIATRKQFEGWIAQLEELGASEAQVAEVGGLMQEALDAIAAGLDGVTGTASEQAQALIDEYITPVTDSWKRFMDSIELSDFAPYQTVESYQRQFGELYAASKTGGADAMNDLTSFLQGEYLPFMKSYYADTGDYQQFYDSLFGAGGKLSNMTIEIPKAIVDTAQISQAIKEAIGGIRQEGNYRFDISIDGQVLETKMIKIINTSSQVQAEIREV